MTCEYFVVDDEQDLLRPVEIGLREAGFAVDRAGTGGEALEKAALRHESRRKRA